MIIAMNKVDRYKKVIKEGRSFLRHFTRKLDGAYNCQLVAEVVHNYLKTGKKDKAGIGYSPFVVKPDLKFATERTIMSKLKRSASHLVIYGERADKSAHWFIAANVNDTIYAIDADNGGTNPEAFLTYVKNQGFKKYQCTKEFRISPG